MAEKRLAERVDDLEESFLVLSGLYAELRKYIEKIDQRLENISGIDEEKVKTLIKATISEKMDEIKRDLKIELLPSTQPIDFESKLKVLDDEIIAIKSKLVDKDELISYIDKKFDETFSDTREKMETVLTSIQSMRREISEIPKNVYEIVEKISNVVENVKNELEKMKETNKELSNSIKEMNESIEKNKDKIYRHDEEIAELNEKVSNIPKIYEEIKELNLLISKLKDEISKVRADLSKEMEHRSTVDENKIKSIVEQVVPEYIEKMDKLSENVLSYIESTKNELVEMKDNIEQLKTSLVSNINAHEIKISNLEEKLSEITSSITKQNENDNEIEKIKNEVSSIRFMLNSIRNDITSLPILSNEIDALREFYTKLSKSVEEIKSAIQSNEIDEEKIKKDVELSINKKIEELNKSIGVISEVMTKRFSEIENKINDEIKVLNSRINSLNEEILKIKQDTRVDKAIENFQIIAGRLADIKSLLYTLKKDIEKHEEEIKSIKSLIGNIISLSSSMPRIIE